MPRSMLQVINAVAVLPELLAEAVRFVASLPPRDAESDEIRNNRVMEWLAAEKGFKEQEIKDLAAAIEFRMTALQDLIQNRDLPGFSSPGEGGNVIDGVVLAVAATEPLIEDSPPWLAFDPDEFRKKLLAAAKPEGSS